ncbi:LD-carboxypeptidase [Micromonospora sp. NPDC001898]
MRRSPGPATGSRANPKPYFGYSDNTNVLNHLHRLGVLAWHDR